MRLFDRIRNMAQANDVKLKRQRALGKISIYLLQHNLSTIPSILNQIMKLARNPNAGAVDYAKACEMDQASSMRILRLANSVYYGPSADFPVRTIKDAIVRIGFKKAQEVIHAGVVAGLFKARGTIASYSPAKLWLNSVAVAIGNRLIYNGTKMLAPTGIDPYLAGLLHNIGIPLMHLCFVDDGFRPTVEASEVNHTLLAEEEEKALGLAHTDVGVAIATKWNLNPDLVNVIGHHHDLKIADPRAEQLTHVTRYAQWMVFELGLGYSDFSASHQEAYQGSRTKLGLIDLDFEGIKQKIGDEIDLLIKSGWFTGVELA